MGLAALVHQIFVPGCSYGDTSGEGGNVVCKPNTEGAVLQQVLAHTTCLTQGSLKTHLQTELRKVEPRHSPVVANTHVHAPACTGSDVDLLDQRHLLDQLSGLLVALLPRRIRTALWRRVPCGAQAVEGY